MIATIEGIDYSTKKKIEIGFGQNEVKYIRDKSIGRSDKIISPGFVDIQINGFKGIDFNEEGLSVADIRTLTKALWKQGVTSYFPTLITNHDEHISTAIKTIVKACNKDPLINQSIAGIHLEGPFLSKESGPRGAHPLEFIKAPDWELFSQWQEEAHGKIKIITLSPEWPQACNFILKCVKAGVLVSIGHTAANSDQIRAAVEAGARLSTHLGNATHLKLPRHNNYVIDQLANDSLWASIIADGFHLPSPLLKTFLKIKGTQTILISDATKFAGLNAGIYKTHIGGQVELDTSGRLFMKSNPQMLAGSAQSLKWCIDHLVNTGLLSLQEAIDGAWKAPWRLLEESHHYGLQKGKKADLIVFEKNSKAIHIAQTIKSGNLVYQNRNCY